MSAAAIIGVVAAAYALLRALLNSSQSPQEPPPVLTTIPFLGPIIDMVRWGAEFYVKLKEKYPNLPLVTLRLPGVRLYVINSSALIPDLVHKWRTFAFPPLSDRTCEKGMGVSKWSMAVMREKSLQPGGFRSGLDQIYHDFLPKGAAGVDDMIARSLGGMADALDTMEAAHEGGNNLKSIKLFDWVSNQFLVGVADGVYGKHNPLRDSENQDLWRKFSRDAGMLIMDILPAAPIFFRKAVKARNALADSVLAPDITQGRYREENGGSKFIDRWTQSFFDAGIPPSDIARWHLGLIFAMSVQTKMVSAWTVYHAFADATLRQTLREEIIAANAFTEQDGTCTINVPAIQTKCPTLAAVLDEVLRFRSISTTVRFAVEDACLESKHDWRPYLIKKGGILIAPHRVQHRLPEDGWAGDEDLNKFDHTRFLTPRSEPGGSKKHDAAGYRPWGGGATQCGGRYIATTEILAFTAMLLMRFDLVPRDDCREDKGWTSVTTKNSSMAVSGFEQPDEDLDVTFDPRINTSILGSKGWRFSFGEDDGV